MIYESLQDHSEETSLRAMKCCSHVKGLNPQMCFFVLAAPSTSALNFSVCCFSLTIFYKEKLKNNHGLKICSTESAATTHVFLITFNFFLLFGTKNTFNGNRANS